MKHLIIFIIICLSTFYSCKNHHEANELLSKAQMIMEQKPDSAMIYIDSILYPENYLRHEKYMEFLVAKVEAKYKNYDDITDDTAIVETIKYFKKKKNYKQLALAGLYSGCVYQDRKQYEDAMNCFSIALSAAEKNADSIIWGRILHYTGTLLFQKGFYEQSLNEYRKAAKINIFDIEKQAESYGAMARTFSLLNENDSAFVYFNKAIDLSKKTNNTSLQSILMQNISVLYREINNYDKSIYYLHQALSLNQDSTKLPLYYSNFIIGFTLNEQIDSASFYAQKLKESLKQCHDSSILLSAYHYLYKNAEIQNQLDTAIYYQKKYSKLIEENSHARLKQSVYKIQQKYNYEGLQNKYKHKLIKRQRWLIILIFILFIGACYMIFIVCRILKKQKEKIELEERLKDINALNLDKDKSLENNIRWRLEFIKEKSSHEHKNHDKEKTIKGNDILVYPSHIDMIIELLDDTYPNLCSFIKDNYKDLTETEYHVFLLTFLPLTVKEIAILLNLSINTVGKSRSSIRKKIGLSEKGGNICDFIFKSFKTVNNKI